MFVIVDIETCGGKFHYPTGRITEICALVHDGLSVTEKFSTLINPECRIAPIYTEITGITNEMVQHAPRFHEIAEHFEKICRGKFFVAHNVSFDYNFIKGEFASLGFNFERNKLCTVKMSRKILPGHKSYSLGKLCADLGIENNARHRAEGDAWATAQLFDLLLQKRNSKKLF
jgi:DNA polymerase III subunit epsilon